MWDYSGGALIEAFPSTTPALGEPELQTPLVKGLWLELADGRTQTLTWAHTRISRCHTRAMSWDFVHQSHSSGGRTGVSLTTEEQPSPEDPLL